MTLRAWERGRCALTHEGTDRRNCTEHAPVNTIPRRGTGLRRALTAGLAVGITLGIAANANAAFPGANGKVAFQAITPDGDDRTNDLTDIYVVNPDGTGLTNLTQTPASSEGASDWSPDGSKIAFVVNSGGTPAIAYMNADGTGVTTIPGTGNAASPNSGVLSWSPDGTMIAYSTAIQGIRIVQLDGTIVRTISPAGFSNFGGVEWSPDGTQLVFDARPDDPTPPEIFRINADGTGSPTRLTNNTTFDTSPDWSPDGTRITWNDNNDRGNPGIAVMPADDGDPETRITTADSQNYRPAFAPDGTKIAHALAGTGLDRTLRVVNPDGTGNAAVGSVNLTDLFNPDWQPVKPVASKPIVVKNVVDPQIRAVTGFEVLKSASTKAGWDAKDGSLRVDYRVEVRRTLTRRGASFGQVQVSNPNPFAVSISPSIAQPGATCDLVDATGTALTGPVTVAANGGATFLFACSAPAVPAASVTSTATVAWSVNGTAQSPVSDAKQLSWEDAQEVTEGPTSVKVTDTMSGKATKVLAEDLSEPAIFRYRTFIKPGQKCRTYKNTARLLQGSVLVPFGSGIGPLPEPKVLDEDFTTVRVCPQVKDEDPSPKDPPVVTVDNGDGAKPAPTRPVDNPKVDPITDPKGGPAKLRVTKTPSVKATAKGGIVTWAITVKNTGKSDLDDVVITDRLPKGLVAVSDAKAPLQKSKRGKRVVSFSVGDLLVGQSVTIRVATRVTGRTGRICNVASATADNAKARGVVSCVRIAKPVPVAAE